MTCHHDPRKVDEENDRAYLDTILGVLAMLIREFIVLFLVIQFEEDWVDRLA